MINELFPVSIVENILSIPIAPAGGDDRLIWLHASDGILSVRSTYFVARELLHLDTILRENRDAIWPILWKSKAGSRVINFAWKILHGIIPSSMALSSRA